MIIKDVKKVAIIAGAVAAATVAGTVSAVLIKKHKKAKDEDLEIDEEDFDIEDDEDFDIEDDEEDFDIEDDDEDFDEDNFCDWEFEEDTSISRNTENDIQEIHDEHFKKSKMQISKNPKMIFPEIRKMECSNNNIRNEFDLPEQSDTFLCNGRVCINSY